MRRVRGRVGLGGAEEGEQEQEHASLRSRPHPALRATFSRCAAEGLSVMPRDEIGLEALLPFTRSVEHTSVLQSIMRTSYDVFCSKIKYNRVFSACYTAQTQDTSTFHIY